VFPGPGNDLYYYGVSLGGIMGTYMAGLTPDIERFVLDVPGVNFSCLLQRANPFASFDALLALIGVNEPLEAALGIQLTHELWASAEPVSVVHHVTSDPLPGAGGPKKVLYDAAWLDKQVSNQCTEIAARTLGLPSLLGSIQQGLVDMPDLPGPLDSAYVAWDLGELDILNPAHAAHIPPLANQIPDGVCDPHPRRPTIPAGIRQIDAFLRPDGKIQSFCDGLCDGNVFEELPAGPCTP
jgi:pimeloyl-ACP methyl ester carboxylesterase